jgi:hypothetical protein
VSLSVNAGALREKNHAHALLQASDAFQVVNRAVVQVCGIALTDRRVDIRVDISETKLSGKNSHDGL